MNNLVAHRGIFNNIDIPENSIKAFELALKHNYSIELDIHITKDNKLVVFHDDNLKRMTNIDKNIEELTLEEITKYKLLNTKEQIPTLSDILNIIKGKVTILIEIKNTKRYKELIPLLINELKNYNGDIIIQSFDHKTIKRTKKYYPSGLLITKKYNKNIYNNLTHKLQLIYCKPSFISINYKLLKNKYYKKLITKYKTYIWTIKKQEQLTKYNPEGYICNNLPY